MRPSLSAHHLRRMAACFATVVTLLAPTEAHAQSWFNAGRSVGDLASTQNVKDAAELGKMIQKLRSQSLGFTEGCSYLGYLRLADTLISHHVDSFKGVGSWKPITANGMPLTDYISSAMNLISNTASKKSAAKQDEALLFQIESVCNAAKQANESETIGRLMASTHKGIGGVVRQVMSEAGLSFGKTPRSNAKDLVVQWDKLYAMYGSEQRTGRDSAFAVADSMLRLNLVAAADLNAQTDTLEQELTTLQRSLTLVAHRDPKSGRWACPTGDYPDPNRAGAPTSDVPGTIGMPICGAATPERAAQILAQVKLLQARITLVGLTAQARTLQADGVAGIGEDGLRRKQEYTHMLSIAKRY